MKSRIIGRKQLLTFSLIFALSATMFVNWYYTKPQNEEKEPEVTNQANLGDAQYVNSNSVSENFYVSAKLNRNKAHDSAKEYLSSIIADEKIDEETNQKAKRTSDEYDISAQDAKVRVLVIPTNEELMIARDTLELVSK